MIYDPTDTLLIFIIATAFNLATLYKFNKKNPMFYGTIIFFWVPYMFNNGMFHPIFLLWSSLPSLYLIYECWFKDHPKFN